MSCFDLPRGELELLIDGVWKSIAFTDRLYPEEIASSVEEWSIRHTVTGARYNGREVTIPKNYHWELAHKNRETEEYETLATYTIRKDAEKDATERRRKSRKDKTIRIGFIKFVED